eukprot:3905389-Prymnesium_polylepis.1
MARSGGAADGGENIRAMHPIKTFYVEEQSYVEQMLSLHILNIQFTTARTVSGTVPKNEGKSIR